MPRCTILLRRPSQLNSVLCRQNKAERGVTAWDHYEP